MRLIIEEDAKAVAKRVAEYIADRIREANPVPERPFVLGLPTRQPGDSPVATYKELIALYRAGTLSFRNVVTFNMGDYCGLAWDHSESHRSFMWKNLFGHIDIRRENVHILDGNAGDLLEECREYERKISAFGGIELLLSSIGSDGRIAFNEPGSSLDSRTRIKALSHSTIVFNSHYFGNDISKVPRRALTLGVGTIMDAREVVLILTGLDKAEALHEAIDGDVRHLCIASAIQKHPHSVLVADEDATASMKIKAVKYFKGIYDTTTCLGDEDIINPAKRRALDPFWWSSNHSEARSGRDGGVDVTDVTGGARSSTMKLMNVKIVRGGELVDEDLWVRDGKILDAAKDFWSSKTAKDCQADVVRDGKGAVVVPGFVELQLNGAFGVDFTSPGLSHEDVVRVAHGILAHGVTSFLPTVITAMPDLYKAVLPKLRPGCTNLLGAEILGVHCEGPFIAWQKKGTHPEECIRKEGFPQGLGSVEAVYGQEYIANGTVRLVTLAPELEGASQAISDLSRAGVTVSIGHTTAGIETAEVAVRSGARKITHLFNAMAPFHHRDPGPVGLLGSDDRTLRAHYGIIADGLHVHPSAVNTAFCSHREGCVLVTDSMAALGLDCGTHSIGGVEVVVERAPAWGRPTEVLRARKAGTDTLAGAVVDMHTCFKNLMAFTGCDVVQAAECASTHAAAAIGMDRKGRLDPGCDADFLLLDPETLDLQETWVGGRLVWQPP